MVNQETCDAKRCPRDPSGKLLAQEWEQGAACKTCFPKEEACVELRTRNMASLIKCLVQPGAFALPVPMSWDPGHAWRALGTFGDSAGRSGCPHPASDFAFSSLLCRTAVLVPVAACAHHLAQAAPGSPWLRGQAVFPSHLWKHMKGSQQSAGVHSLVCELPGLGGLLLPTPDLGVLVLLSLPLCPSGARSHVPVSRAGVPAAFLHPLADARDTCLPPSPPPPGLGTGLFEMASRASMGLAHSWCSGTVS